MQNNDGRGCAPEAQGMAAANGKDELRFSFRDNQDSAGSVAKQACTKFYRENIRLKRAK